MDNTDTRGPAQRVLVAHAGRMGSTREIAEAIGAELSAVGLDVTVSACSDATRADDYDAVVLGSAIYARRWEASARRYLRRHRVALVQRPVWLFHSGPCGPGAQSEQIAPTRSIARMAEHMGAEPPQTFGGRLDSAHATGPLSRWMAARGPLSGDFRDWDLIRAWARRVAADLTATPVERGAS